MPVVKDGFCTCMKFLNGYIKYVFLFYNSPYVANALTYIVMLIPTVAYRVDILVCTFMS